MKSSMMSCIYCLGSFHSTIIFTKIIIIIISTRSINNAHIYIKIIIMAVATKIIVGVN